MFKKEQRLSTNFEFNITRKHGRKLVGKYCYVYYLKPRNYQGITKMGIVVSNKVHKSAVKRNGLKRIFRECIKEKFATIPDSFWIVIHPNSKSLKTSHEEICTDINSLLSKVSVS